MSVYMSQEEQYIEKWVGHLKASDREMSLIAAKKLAKTGTPRVVTELISAVQGRPDDVRLAAIRSLGEIGDRAATRPLIGLLNDYNPVVAAAAADALGAIGDRAAVNPLIDILRDYKSHNSRHFQIHGFNRGLYMAAVYALERIGTPEARRAVGQYHR